MNDRKHNTIISGFERELLSFLQAKLQTIITQAQISGLLPRKVELSEGITKYAQDAANIAQVVTNELDGEDLPIGGIIDKNAVCMFVDMVDSTKRKQRFPIDQTNSINRKRNKFIHYATNQLYIDTMIWVVRHEKHNGTLAGIRGDGAFFVWFYENELGKIEATKSALVCANAIREVINTFVNDMLKEIRIPGIQIRIGMERGPIMITNVGFSVAKELSILGQVADEAAKNSDKSKCEANAIYVPESFKQDYPSGPGGKMSFKKVAQGGYNVLYKTNQVGNIYEIKSFGSSHVPLFTKRSKTAPSISSILFGGLLKA